MTPEEINVALDALRLAVANSAMIDGIQGHGPSQASRDVKLGLTIEQSKPVLEAIIAALDALKS